MIELAKKDDILSLVEIIDQAKEYLKSKGVNQWQDGYPNSDTLLEDISLNRLYVLKEKDIIIGLFAIIDYEKTYDYIEGDWLSDERYLAIHRVAIRNDYKGQNYAKEIFDYAKTLCPYLRIDTHVDNLSMQKALKKNDFIYRGIIYLENGDPRLAFDYH